MRLNQNGLKFGSLIWKVADKVFSDSAADGCFSGSGKTSVNWDDAAVLRWNLLMREKNCFAVVRILPAFSSAANSACHSVYTL